MEYLVVMTSDGCQVNMVLRYTWEQVLIGLCVPVQQNYLMQLLVRLNV